MNEITVMNETMTMSSREIADSIYKPHQFIVDFIEKVNQFEWMDDDIKDLFWWPAGEIIVDN